MVAGKKQNKICAAKCKEDMDKKYNMKAGHAIRAVAEEKERAWILSSLTVREDVVKEDLEAAFPPGIFPSTDDIYAYIMQMLTAARIPIQYRDLDGPKRRTRQ